MKKFPEILGKEIIIGDGAMGTLLHGEITGRFIPEELNLSRPDLIEKIHREYAKSGADFLTTNTFGASYPKLKEVSLEKDFEKINIEAVKIARKVADETKILVAGDIGPCGKLVDPLGELSFDETRNIYGAEARLLLKGGADFILLETITDIQEFRAAVVGILENVNIPVFANMSFTDGDSSMSGTNGETFAVTSGFSGLNCVGSNCGTSLENMETIIEKILEYSKIPVLCQPNAGIPVVRNGETVFNVKADEFGNIMGKFYEKGVSVIGSCCGSTPEFTEILSKKFKGKPVIKREIKNGLFLTTGTSLKEVSNKKIFLVGERINPTGRKKLKKEIEAGRLTTVRKDARDQFAGGSDALDININLFNLDISIVKNVIKSVQNMVDIPLFIDSTDPDTIEEFAKLYRGKGVINSISGEEKSLESILPLAKKYNMAFIAALLDDSGIPENPQDRVKIAAKIFQRALNFGIPPEDIIFDPLVISAGTVTGSAETTLKTLELLKELFPENKTIAGLSNVSFGLPNRELINSTFLSMASAEGLDMVIANPMSNILINSVRAVNLLGYGSKENIIEYTNLFSGYTEKKVIGNTDNQTGGLLQSIIDGDIENSVESTKVLLKENPPSALIEEFIVPAMNEVGRRYQEKIFFLPHLIASADAVKKILPYIKEKLPKNSDDKRLKILFATVKGDVHDIGKNIIISILESFNYNVIDLGKDVPAQKIVETALKNKVDIIGLSTLMTTTIPSMQATIELIKETGQLDSVKIFVGGAVITKKMAEKFDAGFTRDGMEMVNILKDLFKERS
ncbi:MAG: homocysteine S-methyltransferase family protein [Acidobacteriota bacterium]